MKSKYAYLYFDLDRTLWDYNKNMNETMVEISEAIQVEKYCSTEMFMTVFDKHNIGQWELYKQGAISKELLLRNRFTLTLEECGISNNIDPMVLNQMYIDIIPSKTHLIEGCIELLDYLNSNYQMAILTNGFDDVQYRKLRNCHIEKYFKKIITSDNSGYVKPDVRIFYHALSTLNAKKEKSIMIGDELHIDILGARKAGIDQIYFNPLKNQHQEKVSFEIEQLLEIKNIL